MTGATDQRHVIHRSLLQSLAVWLTPLAAGVIGVVLLRLRIEAANGNDLDTGDRGFLLGALILIPLSCYAASGLAMLLTSGQPAAHRHRALWVALASGLAVAAWMLVFGRN